jgi:hypothetical protein
VKSTLDLEVSTGGRTVALRRHPVMLSRSAGLRRVMRRGLQFAGACAEPCNLRGSLLLSRREARRLGLGGHGAGSLRLGGGDPRASSTPSRLVLRIDRRYRRAVLRGRRSVSATLEAVVSGTTGPEQRLNGRLWLHR